MAHFYAAVAAVVVAVVLDYCCIALNRQKSQTNTIFELYRDEKKNASQFVFVKITKCNFLCYGNCCRAHYFRQFVWMCDSVSFIATLSNATFFSLFTNYIILRLLLPTLLSYATLSHSLSPRVRERHTPVLIISYKFTPNGRKKKTATYTPTNFRRIFVLCKMQSHRHHEPKPIK